MYNIIVDVLYNIDSIIVIVLRPADLGEAGAACNVSRSIMCIHIYIYMYMCMYVCIYIYIYTHTTTTTTTTTTADLIYYTTCCILLYDDSYLIAR